VFVASFQVTVIVAVLSSVVEFLAAVTLIVPSLLPLFGETVSQPSPPVTATVQDVLLPTLKLCVLLSELKDILVVLIDK
jgi:hypothetical protein